MNLLTIILIGISLSMDAFSLAILYGSKDINKKDIIKLSISVGLFHLFMPLLGNFLGNIIFNFIKIDIDIVIFIILSVIGLNMIIDGIKQKEIKKIYSFEILAFSLAVSIDSFSVGIGLNALTKNILLSPIIFSIISSLFTYIGLKLGSIMNLLMGNIANIIGGIILFILGIFYIF